MQCRQKKEKRNHVFSIKRSGRNPDPGVPIASEVRQDIRKTKTQGPSHYARPPTLLCT